MKQKGSSNIKKVLAKGFSQQKVVDLDETLTPVVEGFSQEERISLNGLMHAPLILDFSIEEIVFMLGCYKSSADFNSLFDSSNTLVLALYTMRSLMLEIPNNS
jgi:hypothetical protein